MLTVRQKLSLSIEWKCVALMFYFFNCQPLGPMLQGEKLPLLHQPTKTVRIKMCAVAHSVGA